MHLGRSRSILFAFVLLSGCNSAEREPPKTTPAPASSAHAMASMASEPSGSSPSAAPPASTTAPASAAPPVDPAGIGAPRYPVCEGQGANASQLAPSFLDKMSACESSDTAPADKLSALAGDGKINDKGDCEFNAGISCHFHTSMEFVNTTKLKDDEHAVGELHCIVPSADANSPTVYGAHVRCKAGTSSAAGTKVCSGTLLDVLETPRCHSGWKCCDNGTLTKPLDKQSDAEKLVRPDFRICEEDSIELDCGLLHEMHGHTANVAGLGESITGKFNAEKGPKQGPKHDSSAPGSTPVSSKR